MTVKGIYVLEEDVAVKEGICVDGAKILPHKGIKECMSLVPSSCRREGRERDEGRRASRRRGILAQAHQMH
jgi:hypothetical protein